MAGLYAIASTQLRGSMTSDEFTTAMTAGGAFAGITDATTIGPAQVTTNSAGIRYATVPIQVTRGTAIQNGALTLVWDSGAWRVFTVR